MQAMGDANVEQRFLDAVFHTIVAADTDKGTIVDSNRPHVFIQLRPETYIASQATIGSGFEHERPLVAQRTNGASIYGP
jgi:hypothetical protein